MESSTLQVLIELFKEYGATGALFLVMLYIILRGQFSFQYPRSTEKKD